MTKHNKPYFVRQQTALNQKDKKSAPVNRRTSQEEVELERAPVTDAKQKSDGFCFMWIGEQESGW